ncbi:MAG TPA: MarR family winged helix-turn-helix transcriptional regulator [Kofleriaceae bacterium]|jgi:DNA-binding MarR family transcriptional regulator
MTPGEIGLAIKRLQHRHHRAVDRALRALGVSLVQWDVLRHLHAEPDASGRRLAELTFQSAQAFGTLAQRMVDRGMLEREQGPGRVVLHRITPAGDKLRTKAQATVDRLTKRSFSALSQPELDQLGALLARALATPL